MKFKWIFLGFVLLGMVGFAALLPFAYSVAREIRKSSDQFPSDLVRFEQLLRSGDIESLHQSLSAALRQSVAVPELSEKRALLLPAGAARLRPFREYSAFGWQAAWVDDQDRRVGELTFEFWWEDGRHRLRRVMGVLEPSRPRPTP